MNAKELREHLKDEIDVYNNSGYRDREISMKKLRLEDYECIIKIIDIAFEKYEHNLVRR